MIRNRTSSAPEPPDAQASGGASGGASRGASGGDRGVRISAATIEPPKGGGAITGLGQTLEHNPFDGSAVLEIPIPTPSPRGVCPKLALRYASTAGNGPFGMGFTLAAASFTRRSASFGIPRYDATDRFSHSEQGTLVHKLTDAGRAEQRLEPPDAPTWRVQTFLPRLEGDFAHIEHWVRLSDGVSHWVVQTKTNETHVYGRAAQARIFDPIAPTRIAEWLLEETVDAHGNRLCYSYLAAEAGSGRDCTSNRYLAQIAFGNFEHAGQAGFNVRVVLDYGDHPGETPGPDPTATPEPRPDPFSVYTTGFEVRTLWRCRRVLVYTTHPSLFDGEPVLTRALALTYAQGATGLSMLARVEQRGFRKGQDGVYLHEDLAPLTLGFSPFEPLAGRYGELDVDNGGVIPGPVGDARYLPVDLDGEGLPGILYSSGRQLLYWPPLGGGVYGAPVALDRFPSFRDLDGQTLTLASLEGDGRQNIVSAKPGRAGYFTLEPSGRSAPANATTAWSGFRPFEAIPSTYGGGDGALVALNGDGRLDLLEAQAPVLRAYPSLGLRGFGAPDLALAPKDFPPSALGGADVLETFADMFGDGLSHRVRISQGRVECWPDLGYGVFGDKVSLGNAPHYPGAFDASRLFIADLDGSGPADLIYAAPDRLLIHFNRSGNGFSDPVELLLPAPFDRAAAISFADIYGSGAACLILTRLEPQVRHYVYAFSGQTKPYLLQALDTAMGGETRWAYTTSVQEYLRDKRAGRPWATQTYFPIQVVCAVETIDHIAKARNVQRFAYHDGYYDPALKQFQGFGQVETWDSETFEERADAVAAGRTAPDPLSPELFSPVAYTRTWFHTGAFLQAQAIASQNRSTYWTGDPQQPELPQRWIAPDIEAGDASTLRQAYGALAGHVIRQEVYGLDGSADEPTPYSVSQTTTAVRLVQNKGPNPNAVVRAYVRESIDATYERDAADPRIEHDVVLADDAYGQVTLRCSVAYPRRPGPPDGPFAYPEQTEISVTAEVFDYIEHPGDAAEPYRWIGQQVQARSYELAGVAPDGRRYFTFDDLAVQCGEALAHPIAYGAPFSSIGREARLFQWSRGYYWNADQTAPLPLGKIAAHGLAHHGEAAVMTPALVQAAFGGAVSEVSVADAGYALDQGYWWNRGLIQSYEPAAGFFQPARTDGLFPGVAGDSPSNPTTLVHYDAAALYITQISRVGSAIDPVVGEGKAIVLTASVTTDYQADQPAGITDCNGVQTQFLYSPLGRVVATAIVGDVEGRPAGDLPLATRTPTPTPSIAAIVASPDAFLQGSTSYFHYDALAWARGRTPTAVIQVTRQRHVHQLSEGEQSLLPIMIAYSDGWGRDVEQRIEFGPDVAGEETRWVVSGRVRLDNKGAPVETYLAYFARSSDYADKTPLGEASVPPNVIRYDALGRPVRELTSKGFLRRSAYGPWMTTAWDENDTVLDSPFYRSFPVDPVTPEQKREAAALAQARQDYNTPTRTCLNPSGAATRVLAANLGAISPETLAPAVVGQPITAQALWDSLVAQGYLEPAAEIPGAAFATPRLQPYDLRCQAVFSGLYGAVAAPLLAILKQTGLTTYSRLDIEGRVTHLADPRLFWDSLTQGGVAANFDILLDMAGNSLRTVGADAGTRAALQDVFGREVLRIDGAGVRTTSRYDRFARPTEVEVREPLGDAAQPRRAEVFIYGERHPDPVSHNLNGRPWLTFDDAGLETTDQYDLAGDPIVAVRQVRQDYAAPADWTATAIADVERQERFVLRQTFDAEQARIFEQTPDGGVTRFAYTLAGLIAHVTVDASGEGAPRTIVDTVDYGAFGERLRIAYGNGVVTQNSYEPETQRLVHVASVAAAGATLQDVVYTYDPIGNVTLKLDRSWATVFCSNQQVEPADTYSYDPLYRLVRATGRQQAGAGSASSNALRLRPPAPADEDQLEPYLESYTYDDGGNMVRLRHGARRGDWVSDLAVDGGSNRLASAAYDLNGNQISLGATRLRWDFRGLLRAATMVERASGEDDREHYLYDAAGERVLRVSRRLKQASTGDEPAIYEICETLFLGGYERTRIFQESGGVATAFTTSEAIAVPDDEGHFCVLERDMSQARTRRAVSEGRWKARFLLTDQVASVTQEIDEVGARLTYREYCPYGATAFVAAAGDAEAAASKFQFAGKRRDDATGLYYFGARHYAPTLARWIRPDPAGTVDGPNLYAFVTGNPTSFTDPTGLGKTKKSGDISVHSKKIKKPETHASLHKKSEKLGRRIAKEIVRSGVDQRPRLKKIEKQLNKIQTQSGLPIHDEDKVDKALNAGVKGDKSTFDKLFRASLPGMDEQISTATMYYIGKGAGTVTMDETQWKQFNLGFRIASRMRLETEFSGYSTDKGTAQHPTSKGSELFGSSGSNHSYWDRMRREDVVQVGETTTSTGVDRLLDMVSESGRHSLSYGVAPSTAKNVTLLDSVPKRERKRQLSHREGVKKMVVVLQGKDLKTFPKQKSTSRWKPSRDRSPSPFRY